MLGRPTPQGHRRAQRRLAARSCCRTRVYNGQTRVNSAMRRQAASFGARASTKCGPRMLREVGASILEQWRRTAEIVFRFPAKKGISKTHHRSPKLDGFENLSYPTCGYSDWIRNVPKWTHGLYSEARGLTKSFELRKGVHDFYLQ